MNVFEALKSPDSTPTGSNWPLWRDAFSFVAFIGGGLSSIEAAKITIKHGKKPIIIEKTMSLGGIWRMSANQQSRIQVDPISFRAIEDNSPIHIPNANDPFDTFYIDRDSVLSKMIKDIQENNLKEYTAFGVELIEFKSLDNGLVQCKMKNSLQEEWFVDFAELHIRTGSLTPSLHHSNFLFSSNSGEMHTDNNEAIDKFSGKIISGIADDISLDEFKGAKVVIIGMGAFAVENVRRALQGGASSITILSRNFDKLLFPERAGYLLRSRLQEENAFDEDKLIEMWSETYNTVKKAAMSCNMENIVLNPQCIVQVEGLPHFVFSKGLPSMASNIIYLAYYYDLVKIFQDEIIKMRNRTVITKCGRTIEADIVIKCVGFGTDERLFKNHVVQDCYFVDGKPNITHNLRGDKVNGQHIIGPCAQANNFLISYYEDAQEYERCFRRLIECPEAFKSLIDSNPKKQFKIISNVDYFTTLEFSDKLAKSPDPIIQKILANNKATRRSMYNQWLNLSTFTTLDKICWEKMSRYMASVTNKPILPYPFDTE
eukprot:TRINITY_DN10171_c0_g1_i1.p1 TRINITY_DN10171_c0_g1~~TRINITY_DN10171_c0_g1_i1.p1  ORF type:complete len:543 (+),score=25.55 TRINITY_DN10171_c0_g1_i1:50-1678(+)